MKHVLCLIVLLAGLFAFAAERPLFPPAGKWRLLENTVLENDIVRIANTKPGEFGSMGLWMKVYKGQRLTFKVVLRGENIAAKQKPYQGVRFFLWGKVNGKSTEFGENHNLKGSFDWMTITNKIEIPENFDGWLKIGLREVTGTLYIKEVAVIEEIATNVSTERSMVLQRAEQIDLGFLCIAKRNPDNFEFLQMFNKWKTFRPQLKKMKEADALRELDGFESFQMVLYQTYAGNSLNPDFYPWGREKRIERFYSEIKARIADWRDNAKALSRFGLKLSPELDIARMLEFEKKYPGTRQAFSQPFVTATSWFKELTEERMRLGMALLAFDSELPALHRIASLRKAESSVAAWEKQWKALRSEWLNACNNGNFLRSSELEKKAEQIHKKALVPLYDETKGVVVRSGSSLYATGVYGFQGIWHTLLNTNTRNTTLFADPRLEFKPYKGSADEWNVSFDVTGAVPAGFEQKNGSWTHSERTVFFKNIKTGKSSTVDTWWSGIAPGVLYDFHAPSITVSDNTLQSPSAPAGIVAEVNGKVQLFRELGKLDPAKMSANWILLLWDNPAPKMPILMVFENLPGQLKQTVDGLCISASKEIGKVAVGTLFGAVPQSPDYGKNWKTVPADEVARIRTVARLLTWFPLEMEELFSVEKNEIRFWYRIAKAVSLAKDAKPYTPLPPLYAQALLGKTPLKVDTPLSAPVMITKFGPYRYAEGNELVCRIEKPDVLDRIPLKPSGEEAMLKHYNEFVKVRSKNNEWRGTHMADQGLGVLSGWLMMTPETRHTLDAYRTPGQLDRIARGESYYSRGRTNSSWLIPVLLIDPMTGRGGWYSGWRGFRHGFPMKGDMTAFNMELLQYPYQEAKYNGRWDLVERNWEQIKEFYSAAELCQTWRAPGMNCTSSGFILSGDMFGDGYRASTIMYRLALGMGDRALADRALALIAKQNVSTTALIHRNISQLASHLRNTGGPETANGQIGHRIGIDNNGAYAAAWKPYTAKSWNAPFQIAGCTSYDYPFFGMLLRFLPEESLNLVQEMLREIPEAMDQRYYICAEAMGERLVNAFNTLRYLSFFERDTAKIRKIYMENLSPDFSREKAPRGIPEAVWKKQWGPHEFADWPSRSRTLPYIIAQNDPVWVGDYGRMRLYEGSYNRETRTAAIDLGASEKDVLTFVSMVKPESVTLNGKTVEYRTGTWGYDYEVSIPQGAVHVVIQLPPYDPADYTFPRRAQLTPLATLPKAFAPAEKPKLKEVRTVYKIGTAHPVDLADFCNQALNDQLPNAKQDVWMFPKGIVTVCGVPFQFIDPEKNRGKGMIMLRGTERPSYPASVKIPVKKSNVRRLFFLHGACYTNGTKAFTYRLHFQDGQVRDLEIFNGVQVGEWKIAPQKDSLTHVKVAVAGDVYPAGKKDQWGKGVGGYVYVWENDVIAKGMTMQGINQQGMAKLAAIEIISNGQTVPIILAITIEE